TGWTQTDPSGGGAPGNNMRKVADFQYDGGGVGDGNLTRETLIPGGGVANPVTTNWYDWRDRLVATKQGVEASESTAVNRQMMYLEYDNLDQVIAQERYEADGVSLSDGNSDGVPDRPLGSLLRARTVNSFDEQGRTYRTQVYSVDPSNGNVST